MVLLNSITIALVILVLVMQSATSISALPPGFKKEAIGFGLATSVGIEFLPNGLALVGQLKGKVSPLVFCIVMFDQ
jgi:hypothetical protein